MKQVYVLLGRLSFSEIYGSFGVYATKELAEKAILSESIEEPKIVVSKFYESDKNLDEGE